MSRLNSKKDGRILVVMQRLHEQDLAATLIEQGGWDLLSLPAIAADYEVHHYTTMFGPESAGRSTGEALHPAREPLVVLEHLRASMGALTFSAQYLQAPVAAGGNLIKRAWFRTYAPADVVKLDRTVQSWDTALTASHGSDYSVGLTWGTRGKDIFLLDVVRASERWKPAAILIEDRGSGTSLVQDLVAGGVRTVKPIPALRDKLSRAAGASLPIEQGQVYLPEHAPWLDTFLAEVCAFPVGRHDDQVDAMSQALSWIVEHSAEPALLTYYRMLAEEEAQGG